MDFSFGDGVRFVTVRATGVAGVLCLLTGLVVLPGCGDGGRLRYGMTGTVTYEGQPVPTGVIEVVADRDKGNTGPRGYSVIQDGKYEISPERGAITGPVLIYISAADGKNPNLEAGRPYGDWLVRKHKIAADFEPGNKEMDFELP